MASNEGSVDGHYGGQRRGMPPGRLPSLKQPRDLTLGGVPKRTFTPTIPVRRDLSKAESVTAPTAQPANERQGQRGRGERGGERGRGRGGRGRGTENIIQLKGIFDEACKETGRARAGAFRSGGGGGRGGGDDSMRGGGFRVKREKEEDNGQEGQDSKVWLDNLMSDEFADIKYLEAKDPCMVPVFLPASSDLRRLYDSTSAAELKLIDKIKEEPLFDEDTRDSFSRKSSSSKLAKEESSERIEPKTKPSEAAQLFLDSDALGKAFDNLILIQMPDVIPGFPSAKESVPTTSKSTANKTTPAFEQESASSSSVNTCSLSDFSDGLIGKLQIRKSGLTQLVLGDTVLDVNNGAPVTFLQDLVSIRTGEQEVGDMSVLGHVRHKLICVPDLELLVESLTSVRR